METLPPGTTTPERSHARGKVRAFAINGALVLAAVGVTFAAGEAYLRYTNFQGADYSPNAVMSALWTDSDQLLGYVRKPNLTWQRKPYPDNFAPLVSYQTDKDGFRNPPGIETADIAFIGDSFTEGGTMVMEKSFPRLVETRLGQRVVNLGRGSYGPSQELAVLWKYALSYKPKTLVWVLFEGNDLKDSQMAYNGRFRELYLPASTDWSKVGTIWFSDIQLRELMTPPDGDDWYYRAAPLLNVPERLAERHVDGADLIRNGNFNKEIRANQWEISPTLLGSVQRTPTERARNSEYALQVQAPASLDVTIAQVAKNLKPATSYLLTGYIRTKNVLGPARLVVEQKDKNKFLLFRATPGVSLTQEWTKVSLVFTTPATPGDVRILLRRPANPPKPKQGINRLKLADLFDVAVHRQTRLRSRWGLIGTFDSEQYGVTEVGFDYKVVAKIDEATPQGWKVTSEMVSRGQELCRENGIRLLVVYIPIALRVHGPYSQFGADAPVTNYVPGGDWNAPDEFAQRIAALCAQSETPFIDTTLALRNAAGQREMVYAPRFDSHLYYRGHEIVADLIATALEKLPPQ